MSLSIRGNDRIFEDKGRMEEMLWDLLLFYSSLWAFCTAAFSGVPLSFFTTQLDCGLRFKSLRVLEFFFVFSFLKLNVFSFVQFLFLWEGPLILLLYLFFF